MTLTLELDDLSHELPKKTWNLSLPIETRMGLLKKFDSYQHHNIQDKCDHRTFKDGICRACDYKCDHQEIEDGYCLDCGETAHQDEPDDMDMAHREMESK